MKIEYKGVYKTDEELEINFEFKKGYLGSMYLVYINGYKFTMGSILTREIKNFRKIEIELNTLEFNVINTELAIQIIIDNIKIDVDYVEVKGTKAFVNSYKLYKKLGKKKHEQYMYLKDV